MKIGMISWYYLPHPGGVEYLVKTVSEELTNQGHEIEIVTGTPSGDYTEDNPDINVERTEFFDLDEKEAYDERELVDFLTEFIEEKDIDILHAHNFQLPFSPKHTSAIHTASIIADIPVVLHVHNKIHKDTEREAVLLDSFGWDAVIPVSKFVAKRIYNRTNCDSEIEHIPNVVDTEKFEPSFDREEAEKIREKWGFPDKKIILCPTRIFTNDGEMIQGKGVKTFIHALSHLSEHRDDFVGFITGAESDYYPEESKEAKKSLREFAETLNCKENFFIPDGTIPFDELTTVYAMADVVALPSNEEAFGNVYIEGMASGKPAVGCLSGAVPEIIDDNETGHIVKPNSPEKLFEALEDLLDNEEERRRMGEKARATAEERYSVSRVAKQYTELYQSLLD